MGFVYCAMPDNAEALSAQLCQQLILSGTIETILATEMLVLACKLCASIQFMRHINSGASLQQAEAT